MDLAAKSISPENFEGVNKRIIVCHENTLVTAEEIKWIFHLYYGIKKIVLSTIWSVYIFLKFVPVKSTCE